MHDTLVLCQSSVRNATVALHEALEIFQEDFKMVSTSFCLQMGWNNMFDELCDCIPTRAVDKKARESAEKEVSATFSINPCYGVSLLHYRLYPTCYQLR